MSAAALSRVWLGTEAAPVVAMACGAADYAKQSARVREANDQQKKMNVCAACGVGGHWRDDGRPRGVRGRGDGLAPSPFLQASS